MKRVWSILAVCIVLFSISGGTALALPPGALDTTPPLVWGLGISPTMIQRTYCPNNVPVMVQAKASDAGGISRVWAQVKAPGELIWRNVPMTLRADGYWRGWVPKGMFYAVGVWKIRVRAEDYAGNITTTNFRYLEVVACKL